MSKKLTAKDLLKEVRALKKLASPSALKPYEIEYETEAELNASIESVLLDILDGFGYMGATDVIVKGNTAYVKGNFELELDVVFTGEITLDNINEILEDITNGAISESNNNVLNYIWDNASPSGIGTFSQDGDPETKDGWGFHIDNSILDLLATPYGVSEELVYGPLQEWFGYLGEVPSDKFPKEFLSEYKNLARSPYFKREKGQLNWTGDYQTDINMLKKEAQKFLKYEKEYAKFVSRLAKWVKANY